MGFLERKQCSVCLLYMNQTRPVFPPPIVATSSDKWTPYTAQAVIVGRCSSKWKAPTAACREPIKCYLNLWLGHLLILLFNNTSRVAHPDMKRKLIWQHMLLSCLCWQEGRIYTHSIYEHKLPCQEKSYLFHAAALPYDEIQNAVCSYIFLKGL